MKFNLFLSEEENSYLYMSVDNNYIKKLEDNKRITPDLELVFSCDAKTYSEAMQLYYDFVGFGKYILDGEDIIYEE